MAVIFYQLFIMMTMLVVRAALPKLLPITALIWSALTLINLFYPPLIVIQLLVVWVTFAVLRSRGESQDSVPQTAEMRSPSDEMGEPTTSISLRPSPTGLPDIFNTRPSWANQEKNSQFNAAVMLEAMDRYSLPMPYVVQFMSSAESVNRLLWVAASLERSDRTFDEQVTQAARRVKWKWDELPSEEREAFQAAHSRLENIKF